MRWESVNTFFNRIEAHEEREGVRLRKLNSLMQDFVGRPNAQSVSASELGKFTQRTESVETLERNERRARVENSLRGEQTFERDSMLAAEELRKSFRPKRPKAKHLSHVRPARPVAPDVVALGRQLGVVVA